MQIEEEKQVKMMIKYNIKTLPDIVLSDYLDNPNYKFKKVKNKVIWVENSSL